MFSRILETDSRADQPGRREDAEQQHRPAAELQLALGLDHLADVRRVALATGVEDLLADGVELDADLLDVLGRQVGDRVVGLLRDGSHGFPPRLSGRDGIRRQRR
jgi:hypothetical protein